MASWNMREFKGNESELREKSPEESPEAVPEAFAMTVVYRFKGESLDFATVGQLQQSSGLYILVASATRDDVILLWEHSRAKKTVQIFVEVNDEVVAVMPIRKLRPADRDGRTQIWAIVG